MWEWRIFHLCGEQPQFLPGEQVFVWLKSDRDTGRGIVLDGPSDVTKRYKVCAKYKHIAQTQN
jgi:hypothetical protein